MMTACAAYAELAVPDTKETFAGIVAGEWMSLQPQLHRQSAVHCQSLLLGWHTTGMTVIHALDAGLLGLMP
jgi:hypothetical protein